MAEILVYEQSDFDDAILSATSEDTISAYSGTISVGDCGHARKVVFQWESYAKVYGCSKIDFHANLAHLYDSSEAVIFNGSAVVSHDQSSVVAYANSRVTAMDRSKVIAYGDSSVYAGDECVIVARGKSFIYASGNVLVFAYDNSSVYIKDNARVIRCTPNVYIESLV